MADSFNKKEREKKRRKRRQDKADKRIQNKLTPAKVEEFMYLDENGNLSPTPPDPSVKRKEIKASDIRVSTPKDSELEQEDVVRKGVVKFFNTEKRFGFIKDVLTGEDFFVHEENIQEPISERDEIEFEIGNGPKGLVAINVRFPKKVVAPPPPPKKPVAKVEEAKAEEAKAPDAKPEEAEKEE